MYRLPICILSFAFLVVGAVAACQPVDSDAEDDCLATEDLCDDVCVNLDTDDDNCGACGEECDADEVCEDGACELDCASGEEECSGECVDLDTDEENCGDCGDDCAAGEACDDGICVLQCGGATPTLCLNGTLPDGCYDSQTDDDHCGATCIDCSGTTPNCALGVCGP